MSYHCVPLYDTLGENAIEYIINHAEVVVAVVDSKKFGALVKVSDIRVWGRQRRGQQPCSLL